MNISFVLKTKITAVLKERVHSVHPPLGGYSWAYNPTCLKTKEKTTQWIHSKYNGVTAPTAPFLGHSLMELEDLVLLSNRVVYNNWNMNVSLL